MAGRAQATPGAPHGRRPGRRSNPPTPAAGWDGARIRGGLGARVEHVTLSHTDVVIARLPAVEALLPGLREELLAEREVHGGLQVSQVGGWHSVPDLAQRPDPGLRRVHEAIVAAVREVAWGAAAARGLALPPCRWSVQSWAIILDPGGYNRVHDHHESHWSVAYYLDAGDNPDPASGALTLLDPRRFVPKIFGLELYPTALDVPPVTGQLVIFPGFVQHMVQPYRGTRPRVVLSANLSLHVLATP